ncbi:MAG: DUF4147 domain-containing protein [Candidatus Riflebacteria bacterium]|nr:DUF4147 domain-containing protein [Candidatus Riflebacteria bacterium]
MTNSNDRWKIFFQTFQESISPEKLVSDALISSEMGDAFDLLTVGKNALQMYLGGCRYHKSSLSSLVISPDYFESIPFSEKNGQQSDIVQLELMQTANMPNMVQFKQNLHEKTVFVYSNHPIPASGSFFAGKKAIEWLEAPRDGKQLVVCISGGTSALLACPPDGISPEEKSFVHLLLVSSGVNITKINTVRRHLSKVKGGRLFRIASKKYSKILVLALSDVPGDSLSDIGSGPFSPDQTTYSDALDIAMSIEKFPQNSLQYLKDGMAGKHPETLKLNEALEYNCTLEQKVIAGSDYVTEIAGKLFSELFEKSETIFMKIPNSQSAFFAAVERVFKTYTRNFIIIASGECEVKIPDDVKPGKGGRASHLLLALAIELHRKQIKFDLAVIATDNRDGNSQQAGGFISDSDFETFPFFAAEAIESLTLYDSASFLFKYDRFFSVSQKQNTGGNFADILLLRKVF